MPSKTRAKNAAIAAKSAALPKIPKELLDQFVQGPMTAEAIQDVSMAFKKALIERALGGELSHHLGYAPGGDKPATADNHRNGSTGKTVLTEDGPLRIEVPRDREGSFEPLLIPKHERRFTGFDDKIVAMYARGMTVREIQGFLAEQYGTEVAPDFISSVTDAVMAEVGTWQARPLEPMYPVVFFDALRVKIREDAAKAWNRDAPKDSEIEAARKAVTEAKKELTDASAGSGDTSAASSKLENAQKKLKDTGDYEYVIDWGPGWAGPPPISWRWRRGPTSVWMTRQPQRRRCVLSSRGSAGRWWVL